MSVRKALYSADRAERQRRSLYVRGRGRLDRVDVRPVERTVERAVEYILKSLPRRRCMVDGGMTVV